MTDHPVAVVVVAHGSRAEAANDAHRRVVADLAARSSHRVSPAFLELAAPDVVEAVRLAVAEGATEVLVLPYFLYPGRHSKTDIPALVAEAARAHPEVTVRMLAPFGDDPAVVDALAAQIDAQVPPTAG
jgi:sirohydrochlorin ferrochelatase